MKLVRRSVVNMGDDFMLNDKINKIINDNKSIDKDQKISNNDVFGWSKKSTYMRDFAKMHNECKQNRYYYYELKNNEENDEEHQKLVDYITKHPFGNKIRDDIHMMMDNLYDMKFIINVMKDYLTSMEDNIDNYHGKDDYEERILFERTLEKLGKCINPISFKYHKILDEYDDLTKEYYKRKKYIKD